MANSLITTNAQLKELLGKVVDTSLDAKSIVPFYSVAYTKYLSKAFGDAFLNWLSVDSNINAIPTEGYRPLHFALRDTLKSCLAFYIYYEYCSFAIGTSTPNGLVEQKTDTTLPVRKWTHDERKSKSIELASQLLEQAIAEILTNRTVYSQFFISGSPAEYLYYFNQNGTQIGDSVPASGGSHRLWLTLRPWFKQAQRDIIVPNIGADFMDGIITRQNANTLTAEDLALLPLLREVEGYHAYANAFENLNFQQTPAGGIRIYSEFDGTQHAKAPSEEVLKRIKNGLDVQAQGTVGKLKNFLHRNIADYPVYSASIYYTPSTGKAGAMLNANYKTVFRIR